MGWVLLSPRINCSQVSNCHDPFWAEEFIVTIHFGPKNLKLKPYKWRRKKIWKIEIPNPSAEYDNSNKQTRALGDATPLVHFSTRVGQNRNLTNTTKRSRHRWVPNFSGFRADQKSDRLFSQKIPLSTPLVRFLLTILILFYDFFVIVHICLLVQSTWFIFSMILFFHRLFGWRESVRNNRDLSAGYQIWEKLRAGRVFSPLLHQPIRCLTNIRLMWFMVCT